MDLETNQPVAAETQPQQEQSPQATNRQQIYERYYGSGEQTPQEPAQPVQPVAQTPTPQPAAIPNEVIETISALKAEIAGLKAQVPKPVVETPKPTEAPKSWVDLLREGEFDKAEQFIVEKAKTATTQVAVQQAVAEALDLFKIQTGVEQYLNKLRTDNPDIVPMERYLRAPVEARIEAAKNAQKIVDADSFLKIYREAVDAEVEEIRKISRQFRADGKNEATVTSKQVLAASTLAPQQVTINRETGPQEPQAETTESYLAKRMASGRALRGLA